MISTTRRRRIHRVLVVGIAIALLARTVIAWRLAQRNEARIARLSAALGRLSMNGSRPSEPLVSAVPVATETNTANEEEAPDSKSTPARSASAARLPIDRDVVVDAVAVDRAVEASAIAPSQESPAKSPEVPIYYTVPIAPRRPRVASWLASRRGCRVRIAIEAAASGWLREGECFGDYEIVHLGRAWALVTNASGSASWWLRLDR